MHLGGSRFLSCALTLLAAWSLAGCETLAEDAEMGERIERADEVVVAHCDASQSCDCSLTVSQAGCEATLREQWRARLQAGKDRGLTYDVECFAAIEAGIDDAQCAWPPADDRHPCHDHCQLFHGTKAKGESCTRFDDLVSNCEQGLVCDNARCIAPCERLSGLATGEICRDPNTFEQLDRCADGLTCIGEVGRCAKAPAAGEPCLGGECDADSYCDYFTSDQICRARVGVGASCDSAECQPGLACTYADTPDGNYSATCRPRAQQGEPCGESGCDEGLACNYQVGLCTPPAAVGESCLDIGCIDGAVCNYDLGVCVDPPSAGQPCVNNECARGAWCDSTLDVAACTPDLALAAACTGHSQCDSGYCPAGFCDVRPRLGESCAGSLVCELGASCDGQVCRPSMTHGPAVCVYEGW